ncbi:hypothetical protein [Candidatus Amarolinea dominans]|uniref:hypothetical protein n=1 Tax=Candidatus Amarolinea dominans TaxID=3140696 RepID=UPI001DBF2FAE|nr:hypothetical protein [Anaerolineae bacterium]
MLRSRYLKAPALSVGGKVRLAFGSLLCVIGLAGCGLAQIPDNIHRYETRQAARYPWTVEAINEEHKTKLCQALQLEINDPFCQAGARVTTTELMHAVKQRFPVNRTTYPEVATALQGFPVAVEESKLPTGEVTSRSYAYLLTQFHGFCTYFDINLDTQVVERIDNTKAPGLSDGPIPEVCGPAMGQP